MDFKKFPKGHTAFLVIHGIGEQNPLETLDSFSRWLIQELQKNPEGVQAEHRIAERADAHGSRWTESFVRLTPKLSDGRYIDIHEYYWAYLTEDRITIPEITEWVMKTLKGTKNFYSDNPALAKRYKKYGLLSLQLRCVYWHLAIATALYPFARLLRAVFSLLPGWSKLPGVEAIIGGIRKKGKEFMLGFIGDIAIYTTTDQKSKFYQLRQQILANSQSFVEDILFKNQYDRVIIAGHSLGSVIAYDTLNRLNIKVNLDPQAFTTINKLTGLITFGSPLDKIAFFFRETARNEEYVRRAITDYLHSFKARTGILTAAAAGPVPIQPSIEAKLDYIHWKNYYSKNDPVSGHLDFYAINTDDNIKLTMKRFWGFGHTEYWEHEPFYQDLIMKFL